MRVSFVCEAGYANRPHGWDGFQGKPIEPSAIADATKFVELLPDELPPPIDQPCSDGEVSLVWRFGACFAEISFPGDHTFYWYCTNGSEEDASEGVSINSGIPAALSRIMGFGVDRALRSKRPMRRSATTIFSWRLSSH